MRSRNLRGSRFERCASRARGWIDRARRSSLARGRQEGCGGGDAGYAADLQSAPAAKVAAHFAPDGALLLPGIASLRGPATIRKFLDPMAASITVQSVTVATELLEVHGGTADQWGTYKQTAGETGKAMQHLQGRYGAFWRHERDGHWRLVRLMMQPTPAPEAGK